MRSFIFVLLISVSHICLGHPQQEQHDTSMGEIQTYGGMLDQHTQHRQGAPPVRVQARNINVINEPTCDELKAMWRFSKRQARTPEIMNEISTYKDPFSYNEWAPYYSTSNAGYVSSSRSAGGSGGSRFRTGPGRRLVFGRVVHKAPLSSAVGFQTHRGRGYDQVARLYGALQGDTAAARHPNILRLPGGGGTPQTGRFQDLKKLIQNERARDLEQLRAAEELAARAAALKEIAGGQRFDNHHGHKQIKYLRDPWSNPQDLYSDEPTYYHTIKDRYSGDAGGQSQFQDGMISYMDPLAPPSRRSGMWQVQTQQFLDHRNHAYDQQQPQRHSEQPIILDHRTASLYSPLSLNIDSNANEYPSDSAYIDD